MDRSPADVVKRLSQLDSLRVDDPNGHCLGHVFDLSCRWIPGDADSPIEELIYGAIGLMERLGWQGRKPTSVNMRSVQRIDESAVTLARTRATDSRRG